VNIPVDLKPEEQYFIISCLWLSLAAFSIESGKGQAAIASKVLDMA
jgi:hypothetical protein